MSDWSVIVEKRVDCLEDRADKNDTKWEVHDKEHEGLDVWIKYLVTINSGIFVAVVVGIIMIVFK